MNVADVTDVMDVVGALERGASEIRNSSDSELSDGSVGGGSADGPVGRHDSDRIQAGVAQAVPKLCELMISLAQLLFQRMRVM